MKFTLEILFKNDPIHYHATPFYFAGLEKAYRECFEMANKGSEDIIWSAVEPVAAHQYVPGSFARTNYNPNNVSYGAL